MHLKLKTLTCCSAFLISRILNRLGLALIGLALAAIASREFGPVTSARAADAVIPSTGAAVSPDLNRTRNSVTFPFESFRELIFVQVAVNGSRPLSFILDTGAKISCIDSGAAKFEQGEFVRIRGVGGSADGIRVRGLTLSFGGLVLSNRTLAAISLARLPPRLGHPVDGLIGFDLLKDFIVTVDYDSETITMSHPMEEPNPIPGEVLPLDIDGSPVVEARLHLPGRPPVEGRFQIDTGYTASLQLSADFTDRNRLLKNLAETATSHSIGAGGKLSVIRSRADALQLGPFTVARPIVSFHRDSSTEPRYASFDGNIGTEFLRRFRVTFDLPGERLVLEPGRDFGRPDESDMSGLELMAEGAAFSRIRVVEVHENTPAAEAGLAPGDWIESINGVPAGDYTLEDISELLMHHGAVQQITIRRNGQSLHVQIKLRRLI